MDSKVKFQETIFKHYLLIAEDKITVELLNEVSNSIASYYYDQYNRFTLLYPKSVKRYFSFDTRDLEHPTTYEILINFFKQKIGPKYSEYSKILLKMNDAELADFEKSRQDFYDMF